MVNVAIPDMVKVFDDGYFSIHSEEHKKTLYYKIKGYPKYSEIIRNGHDIIFQLIHRKQYRHQVVNLVADLLEAKILLENDIKFISKVSYPRLARAGVKNLAILLSGELHVKINVDKTLHYLGPDVFDHVALFNTAEEADEWFKTLA